MNITNTHNLPESIYRAIINDDYVRVGDYSATSLIKPVQMLALERRYDAEITIDASDMLWMLLGKAMHKILETGNHTNSIIEARLKVNIGGIILSAKPDLYHITDKSIDDYKVTSVYSFLLGDKIEWEQQLNINSYIYKEHGFPVERVRIYAILRDHIKGKAKGDKDYPEIPFIEKGLKLWDMKDIKAYIQAKVFEHETYKKMSDDLLPPCTDEERWIRADKWAVIKKGNKKATKVFDDSQSAYNFFGCQAKDQYEVVHRKGDAIRCQSYCNAAPFCKQWGVEKENN